MSDQTPFEKRSRELLDESASRLDGRTLSRLTQARHAALAQLDRPARSAWRTWMPAGAAAAAVAALVITTNPGNGVKPLTAGNGASALEDIDLLADADALDLVSSVEDPEFYEWAAGELES